MNKIKQEELGKEIDELINLLSKKNQEILRIIISEKEYLLVDINNEINIKTKNLEEIEKTIVERGIALKDCKEYLRKVELDINTKKIEQKSLLKNVDLLNKREIEFKEKEEKFLIEEGLYRKNLQHLENEKKGLILIRDEIDKKLVEIELSQKPIYMYARGLQRTMDEHKYDVNILQELSKMIVN